MEADLYQALTNLTAKDSPDDEKAMRYVLGLVGEAGEVAELFKKAMRDKGHILFADPAKLGDELGDVLWYVAQLAEVFQLSLSAIMEANLDKLRKRYSPKTNDRLG